MVATARELAHDALKVVRTRHIEEVPLACQDVVPRGDGSMMAVPVTPGAELVGSPQPRLFSTRILPNPSYHGTR